MNKQIPFPGVRSVWIYNEPRVPVCITIYSVSRHGKSTDRSRHDWLPLAFRADAFVLSVAIEAMM